MIRLNTRSAQLLMVLLPACGFISCKKDNLPVESASLTMVNAVSGSRPLSINFSSEGPVNYKDGKKLNYSEPYRGEVYLMVSYAGPQRLRLFQYPDTTTKDVPLFDLQLNQPIGSIGTLFLTGKVEAPDTLLTRDIIPFFPAADSAMAIRFVNLSPGSDPVSINIKGLANGSEISSIAYKKVTGFKNYPVKSGMEDYVFEFRNTVSGNLLASVTTTNLWVPDVTAPSNWLFHSFTLVLAGEPGGTGNRAQTGFIVGHYR